MELVSVHCGKGPAAVLAELGERVPEASRARVHQWLHAFLDDGGMAYDPEQLSVHLQPGRACPNCGAELVFRITDPLEPYEGSNDPEQVNTECAACWHTFDAAGEPAGVRWHDFW